jgi:hypothetical protein
MGLPNKNYWEEAENNSGISSIVLILYELMVDSRILRNGQMYNGK